MAGSSITLVADAEQKRVTDIIDARRLELPPGCAALASRTGPARWSGRAG